MTRSSTRAVLSAVFAALTLLSLAPDAHAGVREAGKFGIGVGAGTLARGFSLKYFLGNELAVQGVVGVYGYGYGNCWVIDRGRCIRTGRGNALALGADLLSERPDIFSNGAVSVAWNVGGGLGLGIPNSSDLGVSISLIAGLEINIDALPIDVVLEYRPTFFISPFTAFDYTYFTGHIRYYF